MPMAKIKAIKSLISFSHTSHHTVILAFEPTPEFRASCRHLFAYPFVSTTIHCTISSEKKSSKHCRGETFEASGTQIPATLENEGSPHISSSAWLSSHFVHWKWCSGVCEEIFWSELSKLTESEGSSSLDLWAPLLLL